MTEFEAATLALQQQQLWAAIAIPLVTGLVGLGQILIVHHGIGVMDRANRDRARQVETQRVEADQRHAEAMAALQALIKGMEQQGESLRAAVKGMEQQGESLRAVIKGMETVIERTVPKG